MTFIPSSARAAVCDSGLASGAAPELQSAPPLRFASTVWFPPTVRFALTPPPFRSTVRFVLMPRFRSTLRFALVAWLVPTLGFARRLAVP